jgi:hypothetical protein
VSDELPLPSLDDLSDRALLVLAIRELRAHGARLDGLHEAMTVCRRRVTALEHWRTGLAGAWATAAVVGWALKDKIAAIFSHAAGPGGPQ